MFPEKTRNIQNRLRRIQITAHFQVFNLTIRWAEPKANALYPLCKCTDCTVCRFYERCCKSAQGHNRTRKVNERLDQYKQQARDNLNSQKGFELQERRSIEI